MQLQHSATNAVNLDLIMDYIWRLHILKIKENGFVMQGKPRTANYARDHLHHNKAETRSKVGYIPATSTTETFMSLEHDNTFGHGSSGGVNDRGSVVSRKTRVGSRRINIAMQSYPNGIETDSLTMFMSRDASPTPAHTPIPQSAQSDNPSSPSHI
ncbi:hypothetical protein EYC80_004197 [Monilinia laxa]|uniref:Uncharacterized protein n=1 Tax=Monilinia laxa TaxID=61186 RepID=A0A5N6KM00_MONLA|nr:hypothetical protein EYC80_004197 [Monilinia laxa]